MRNLIIYITTILFSYYLCAQNADTVHYKKRILENYEVEFLTSFYHQDGDSSAVGGGIGSEKLTDATPTFIITIPLNEDDILSLDAGISVYSSASSSNIDPFDGNSEGSPYNASSGASSADALITLSGSFTRYSDDRNTIRSFHGSAANEFDYFSVGAGGRISKLFNSKNTEIGVHGNIYLDQWKVIYPIELRNSEDFAGHQTDFKPFDNKNRNSYTVGASFSQILSKRLQSSFISDVIYQEGLLSTPYQRVYFADKENYFIENFQLADDVEQLPGNRIKVAVGSRFNYFFNDRVVLRTYYRYYQDNWGIKAHTYSIELPIKWGLKYTFYPIYRIYNQDAADYFAGHEEHLSTSEYYTSDYDLSAFNSRQLGLGIRYGDPFTKARIFGLTLKSMDLRLSYYERSNGLTAQILSFGMLMEGN